METTIRLRTEFIHLAALLKLAGVAESGGRAKQMVQEGLVSVNGELDTRRGAKIRSGDVVHVSGDAPARITVV